MSRYIEASSTNKIANPLLSDDDDDDDDEDESSTTTTSLSNSGLIPNQGNLVELNQNNTTSNSLNVGFLPLPSQNTSNNIVLSNNYDNSEKQENSKQSQLSVLKNKSTIPQKIQVRFQSIGSTAQIEPRVYRITSSNQFISVVSFLGKKLKNQKSNTTDTSSTANSSIFCYIRNSFSPSNDEILSNLFVNFAVNQELVVSYCENIAFG